LAGTALDKVKSTLDPVGTTQEPNRPPHASLALPTTLLPPPNPRDRPDLPPGQDPRQLPEVLQRFLDFMDIRSDPPRFGTAVTITLKGTWKEGGGFTSTDTIRVILPGRQGDPTLK
jgi:hypothetical protein